MILRGVILFFALLLHSWGIGQSTLQSKIDQILSAKTFEYASVGLSIRSENGEEVLSVQSDKKLIPASSLKLITSFLTLDAFGEDFTFTTRVGYAGEIDRSGTLEGNIVIIGTGDPTFGSGRFGAAGAWNKVLDKIVNAIEGRGITCIEGKIEVKTNVFQGQAICPSWPYSDIANYYGSGAWGLNFNENKYDLYFSAKVAEGAVATLDRIDPEIPNMYLQSEVIVKGPNTGDNAYIYGDPFHYAKIVRGSIPFSKKPFCIKGAMPNPPLSFGLLLENALTEKEIKTNGSIVSQNPIKKSEFHPLIKFKLPQLSKIIEQANAESINLYCEAFLRLLGRKFKKEGSIDAGLAYVEEQLTGMNIPKNSFTIKDGGGLSPRNAITPASFTRFLEAQRTEIGEEQMQRFIPQVGVSGTVKSLMNNRKGQQQFYLKSGSMGGVLTYTGIFTAKSGKSFSICFMSNNHSSGNRKVRREAEKIFELVYENL